MKKFTALLLILIVILSVAAMSAFAETPTRGIRFTDEDNNGVCDRYEAGECETGCGADRGQGLGGACQGLGNAGCGAAGGRGCMMRSFADINGDGICDNFSAGMCGRGAHCGRR